MSDNTPIAPKRDPVTAIAMLVGMLVMLIASVITGYVARDPGRRRRALNRAGRTWLRMEDTAYRRTQPLRRKQRRVEAEVVQLAEQLWEKAGEMVFSSPCVPTASAAHRPYAHGAFMGAAPALLADRRWRQILAFLMPDVFRDVADAVERGIENKALIPMFDNNPVVAAFGIATSGDRNRETSALEWDVFLSSALVDDWHASAPEPRGRIVATLVDGLVIAHASTTDTVQEQMGLCQWGDVRKTRKTALGGVQFGAWLDLFARALLLSASDDLSAAIASMQQLPRRHEAEECLKHTFEIEMTPDEVVDILARVTDRPQLSVVLEVKSLQIGPLLLRALVGELNSRGIHVSAVGSFQHAEIATVSRMEQHVRGETLPGPREIVFLHFVGDVQAECNKGRLQRGTSVMFNGASLLLAAKEGDRFCYRLDEPVLDDLEGYRQRYDLFIGIYVQENDCDAEAVSMLSALVCARPTLFTLGFAWGGTQGEAGIAAGLGDHRGFGLQRLLGQVGVAASWKPVRSR